MADPINPRRSGKELLEGLLRGFGCLVLIKVTRVIFSGVPLARASALVGEQLPAVQLARAVAGEAPLA